MADAAKTLRDQSGAVLDTLRRSLVQAGPGLRVEERGKVVGIGAGVATIEGFSSLRANELVQFPKGLMGVAFSLRGRETGVYLLDEAADLREGDEVRRTGRVADTAVGDALLGRVVDGLGRSIDDKGVLPTRKRRAIEQAAPAIMDRAPVATPLHTGLKAIDATVPIGRGQRELILGDRQTGKTSIALDAILNQRDTGVVSVYCAIGQRASAVARVVDILEHHDALHRTVVVVANGDDPPGVKFTAPYAATTIAEHFMNEGRDVLIVYDDLTRHARAYRELSLLMRRPPGREAYPGDIFYVHSRLLERATHLRDELGGGSMTALPIVETHAQNISAYIPTNLISITDGQIYVSPSLFEKGQLPAIDIGKSVSRVGGKAQGKALRDIAGDLRLAYSQYSELETFSRFGARLDEDTRAKLDRGRRVREILKQQERAQLSPAQQIVVLLAATSGLLDDVAVDDVRDAEARLLDTLAEPVSELEERLARDEGLDADTRQSFLEQIEAALKQAGLKPKEHNG